jgi:hypothetical protein
MVDIIVNDIVPIFVIMILGYVMAKLKKFDADQMQGLNKVVLDIALPCALFVSITEATREELLKDGVLTAVAVVGVVLMFMLSYFLCRKVFKHSIQEAAVCALIAGSPTIGFLGFAVLDPIFGTGTETGLVIGIVAIVVNAITIPIGYYLLNVGANKDPNGKQIATGKVREGENKNVAAIVNALKQPVVWSPLLALIIVLVGIRIPEWLYPSFELIAKANSGVAVLAAGIALSTVKFSIGLETIWNTFWRMILTPLVICVAGALLGITGDKLAMLTMAVALPPAFSGIIISSRYGIYVREGASSLAVSTLVFVATCPLWVWAAPMIEKLLVH